MSNPQAKPAVVKPLLPTLDVYLAPGESLLSCPYPPYCTLKPSAWRKVTYSLVRKDVLGVRPDKLRMVVGRWVEQLVRRELGSALLLIEAKSKRKLRLDVSAQAAELIQEALENRVRGKVR